MVMKYEILENKDKQIVELSGDGHTVWVCNWQGYTIGRFSAKGIDVHAPPDVSDRQCLHCEKGSDPFGKPKRSEWDKFVSSMLEFHGVQLPGPEGFIELKE